MKERPILFSAPMVRALLDGSKTQTRRVMKPQPRILAGELFCWKDDALTLEMMVERCPHGQIGDRLWVKETHYIIGEGNQFFYKATGGFSQHKDFDEANGNAPLLWTGPWKPSIHMPRAASRITLEITDVRVERLTEISEADAIAEGRGTCKRCHDSGWVNSGPDGGWQCDAPGCLDSAIDWYHRVWESINGKGSWDLNPWVWKISFKVVKP